MQKVKKVKSVNAIVLRTAYNAVQQKHYFVHNNLQVLRTCNTLALAAAALAAYAAQQQRSNVTSYTIVYCTFAQLMRKKLRVCVNPIL